MFMISLIKKLNDMTRRAEKAEQKLLQFQNTNTALKTLATKIGALPTSAESLPLSDDLLLKKIEKLIQDKEVEAKQRLEEAKFTQDVLLESMGYLHARIQEAAYFSDVEKAAAEQQKIHQADPSYRVGFEWGVEYAEHIRRLQAQQIPMRG